MHYFFFWICTTSACATLNSLTSIKGSKRASDALSQFQVRGAWRCLTPDGGAGQPSHELLVHTPPPFRDKSEPGWAPASGRVQDCYAFGKTAELQLPGSGDSCVVFFSFWSGDQEGSVPVLFSVTTANALLPTQMTSTHTKMVLIALKRKRAERL